MVWGRYKNIAQGRNKVRKNSRWKEKFVPRHLKADSFYSAYPARLESPSDEDLPPGLREAVPFQNSLHEEFFRSL